MARYPSLLLRASLALASCLAFPACGGGSTPSPTPAAGPVRLSVQSLSLLGTGAGSSQSLTATETNFNGLFTIATSPAGQPGSCAGIATASPPSSASGVFLVTALSSGSCSFIVAGAGGQTASLTVSVNTNPPTHTLAGVYLEADAGNEIVGLQTTLVVPPMPPATGTLFLWPGLDPLPGGANFLPINNGVLQPVLTWGSSCAPGHQPPAHSTWWISAQYVNTFGSEPGFVGCQGGQIMSVNVGDSLSIVMILNGTVWNQVVTDTQSGRSVDYQIDLQGQAQGVAYFQIEGYGQHPVGSTVFANTSVMFRLRQSSCVILQNGQTDSNDVISNPVLLGDNLTCRIATMTLYAPVGAMATGRRRPVTWIDRKPMRLTKRVLR